MILTEILLYDSEDVFVYADCPYLGTEDYYEYVFSAQDHKDLAEMLKSHKGKFALSCRCIILGYWLIC